jgi:hypothetical protein
MNEKKFPGKNAAETKTVAGLMKAAAAALELEVFPRITRSFCHELNI